MRRYYTAISIVVTIFFGGNAKAQHFEPKLFLPCGPQLRVGSTWKVIGQDYSRHNRRVMPMSETKRCDLVFLNSSDSARLQISFCHENQKATDLEQIDSTFTKQLGLHKVRFTRVRMTGRILYDINVNSDGCMHAWGTLIRAEELPAMESFLRDLSMEDLRD